MPGYLIHTSITAHNVNYLPSYVSFSPPRRLPRWQLLQAADLLRAVAARLRLPGRLRLRRPEHRQRRRRRLRAHGRQGGAQPGVRGRGDDRLGGGQRVRVRGTGLPGRVQVRKEEGKGIMTTK